MNLAAFDLNLLRVFDALFAERNVTRAGERLGLSQPAVSAALGRLRHVFGDELFVRDGHAMVPTPRATELATPIREALRRVETMLANRDEFSADTALRRFTMLAPDYVTFLLVPPLMIALAKEAPGIDLGVVDFMFGPPPALLEAGRIDIAIDIAHDQPSSIRSTFLMGERYAVIMRADGSAAATLGSNGALSLDDYCRFEHVIHSIEGGLSGSADAALATLGRARRVVLGLPHFLAIARTVATSEMIATFPHRLARELAPLFNLAIAEAPIDLGPISLTLSWHRRVDGDAGHRWLRNRIVAIAAQLDGA